MKGHGDKSQSVDEEASRAMGVIQPTFDVGPPGVGPVTGIDSGDFFQPPRSEDQAAEHAADPEGEAD